MQEPKNKKQEEEKKEKEETDEYDDYGQSYYEEPLYGCGGY